VRFGVIGVKEQMRVNRDQRIRLGESSESKTSSTLS